MEEFSYLGVVFNYNGKFTKAKSRLVEQARKGMFAVINISLQLHLFDTMITPILLYGSEVWGFENLNIIESFYLKYCKMVLRLKPCTANCMLCGELGVISLSIFIKSRVLCYWSKLFNAKDDKIGNVLYRTMLSLHNMNVTQCPWISFVKTTLDELGLSEYFVNQRVENTQHFKSLIKNRLFDQFIQNWSATVNNSATCLVY